MRLVLAKIPALFAPRRVPRWRWGLWFALAVAALATGFSIRERMGRYSLAAAPEAAIDGRIGGGTLVIAGGGELPNQIRQKFVELAGGAKARIVVLPAVRTSDELERNYVESWKTFGVNQVRVLRTTDRAEAERNEFSAALEDADGVWIGGGSQTSLVNWYGGTPVERRIKRLLDRGGVVGGTSAGAAVMSGLMIAGGRDGRTLSQGFGLWPDVVIDQHFLKRNRWRRLQYALSTRPELTGLGIDEDTALVVERKTGRFVVLGKSYVTICVPEDGARPARVEFLKAGDLTTLAELRAGVELGPSPTEFDAFLLGE